MLARMFAGFRPEPDMIGVVGTARAAGIRTGLLSNSWGLDYPREGWDELFDVVVISGEVGLRKPDPAIYLLAADRLRLRPAEVVFVDDLAPNVRGAAAAGMVGVQHTDVGRDRRRAGDPARACPCADRHSGCRSHVRPGAASPPSGSVDGAAACGRRPVARPPTVSRWIGSPAAVRPVRGEPRGGASRWPTG